MRYLKYVALLAILMVPFAYSQAQVRVGIGIGVGPGYVAGRRSVRTDIMTIILTLVRRMATMGRSIS